MKYSLADLAEKVGGLLTGDGQLEVRGANPLSCASEGEITLIDTPDKATRLESPRAVAAIVPTGVTVPLPSIQVDDVHAAFEQIVRMFRPPRQNESVGRSPAAHIHPTARLADDVDVYPGAVIGADVEIGAGTVIHSGVHIMPGCRIGAGVTIFPGAVLYEDTVVGDRSMLHANCVLGAYGFGYKQVAGEHVLTAQLGYVLLESDVHIGAGTTIDRGVYGPTIISRGTKIDNQVQIGHNCRLGRHNLICSQVGIAGSTTTGDYVVMAGQVGVRDHVHIGHRAQVGAQAGVDNNIADDAIMLGSPATPVREQWMCQSAFHKLPDLRREFRALQRKVEQLSKQIEQPPEGDRHAA